MVDNYTKSKIIDAAGTICMECLEDTLNNPNVCNNCPVRKLCNSLEINKEEY